MHISKVTLENIKSHAHATFEFERGTTAITGANGAGKTTIIEAIAWVLFDLLDYKKEDFVRRGTKKGSATVTIESGLDERLYVVYRDTGTGYYVTDPRLRTRIADKKEEVFRFIWQHLGLEPGTDLKSLFRQAIGVPQGTFTAIFLEGATERKSAFDRLLKVEEYRKAAEKLRETSRYLDGTIADVRETIARAEGELARSENVETEHEATIGQVTKLTEEISVLSASLERMRADVAAMDEKEKALAGLKSTLDQSVAEKDKAEIVFSQTRQNLDRSLEAAAKIDAVRMDHERHLAALARLSEFESRRRERDRLSTAAAAAETKIIRNAAEKKRLEGELLALTNARTEVETLRPKAATQATLDEEAAKLRAEIAEARAASERIISIDANLERLRVKYRANQEEKKRAEEMSKLAVALKELELNDARLVQDLAHLQAHLERDQKFQSEIRNGLCPIMSQRCLNLAEGETLETFIYSQFTNVKSQISEIETRRAGLAGEILTAREAQQSAGALENLRRREEELKEDGRALTEKKAVLEEHLKNADRAAQRLAQLESKIKELDDPTARIRYLELELAKEGELRQAFDAGNLELERLESERKDLTERLQEFATVDEQLTRLSAERDATASAHAAFLANEADARARDERKSAFDTASRRLSEVASSLRTVEQNFAQAAGNYDIERHARARAELLDAERRHAERRATLDAAKHREQQLAAEIAGFANLRKSLRTELQEKERLEDVAATTAFIRETLKEAAPRVARNYVHHVSLEANQMFREITSNAEQTLKWAEDYSIVLEEEGFERPFISLSGGEQMSAALSVRLALLKQLSDIRLAFFDEPTTNLDVDRRENLAMELSRITHFDQLFVISHDDTFDSYVDHVLAIG